MRSAGRATRADAGERLIDNTDFRVDEDWTGRYAAARRVDNAETAIWITRLQTSHALMQRLHA